MYPNPNRGTFALLVPECCVTEETEVNDLNGKVIKFESYSVAEIISDLKLQDIDNGILLVNVKCKNGEIYTNRIIISK